MIFCSCVVLLITNNALVYVTVVNANANLIRH